MSLHTNHNLLRALIIGVFAFLSIGVSVLPAYYSQKQAAPLEGSSDLTSEQRRGLETYVAEGCVACHTQQVRTHEMDLVWGSRPSIASDYYYSKKRMGFWRQSPSLLGSERTGPDLTTIGERQPSVTWHLLHLYNPRVVVESSIMPAYPWLFEEKATTQADDVVIQVPDEFKRHPGLQVVARQAALDLVEYLLSLKQVAIEEASANFTQQHTGANPSSSNQEDGASLYVANCSACHQPNGEGLPGAFPSLKGSDVVLAENPLELITAILTGFDKRDEFGVMPPFGGKLTNEQIAAIVNHERRSWGNNATTITVTQVQEIRDSLE